MTFAQDFKSKLHSKFE